MNAIKLEQLKCLNTMISKLKISKDMKAEMVYGFSGGRATSSKDLFADEATAMIKHLKSLHPQERAGDVMRKKIISLAHEMGWHLTPTLYKGEGVKRKADMKRINDWCRKFGYLHKSLDNYTYQELPALVSQFEKVYKSYLSAL